MEHFEDFWPEETVNESYFDAHSPDIELLEEFDSHIQSLKDREADIIERRLGIGGYEHQSFRKIADDYSISAESIRRIQLQAFRKLFHKRKNYPVLRKRMRSLRSHERGIALRSSFPTCPWRILCKAISEPLRIRPKVVEEWLHLAEYGFRTESELSAAHSSTQILEGVLWSDMAGVKPMPIKPSRETSSTSGNFQIQGFSCTSSPGSFWSRKLNRNVTYESKMELAIFTMLEKAPTVLTYCEQPLAIPYWWDTYPCKYFPDIAVQLEDNRIFLIEVKPMQQWAEARNIAKWNAAIDLCERNGWGFKVMDGKNHPSKLLKNANTSHAEILQLLTNSGTAYWPAFNAAWTSKGHSWRSFTASALANGFSFQYKPFRLEKVSNSLWLDRLNHSGT